MKVEAVPFYGIAVAMVGGITWFLVHYEFYRFREPAPRQYCQPAIMEGTQRVGRDVAWLDEQDLQVGDLVRFRTGRSGNESTSRVIALSGQRVAIRAGRLHLDGAEVADPWGKRGNAVDFFPEVVVPEGCVFLLNDHRWGNLSERMDSRAFGPVPVRCIEYVFSPKDEGK